jgi:hypothetical protein
MNDAHLRAVHQAPESIPTLCFVPHAAAAHLGGHPLLRQAHRETLRLLHPLAFPLSRLPALPAALLGKVTERDYYVFTKCRNQGLILLVVKTLGEQMLIHPKRVQEVTILRPEAFDFRVRHLPTVRHRGVAVDICVSDANKVLRALLVVACTGSNAC